MKTEEKLDVVYYQHAIKQTPPEVREILKGFLNKKKQRIFNKKLIEQPEQMIEVAFYKGYIFAFRYIS